MTSIGYIVHFLIQYTSVHPMVHKTKQKLQIIFSEYIGSLFIPILLVQPLFSFLCSCMCISLLFSVSCSFVLCELVS